MQDGGAHPGWGCCSRAAHRKWHGMLLSQGYKATRMRAGAAGLPAPLVPGPGRQGQAGGEKRCSPGARSPPRPPSEHWGIISPFNHKKQICACHQRAVRMETAAQTSMGHTHTHRGEKKKLQKSKSCNFFPFYFQFIGSTAGKMLPDSFRAFDTATT